MMTPPETELRTSPVTSVAPRRVTAEEFIASEQDEGGLAEWMDGRVIVHDVPKEVHQRIAGLLFFLLYAVVERYRLGRVIIAPYRMRPTPSSPVREPDVLFVTAQHQERLTENLLVGPADLVIEVVSDDSTARDRSDKFDEYEGGGVPEYWVVDSRPGHERADFWVLDANGRYRSVGPSEDGTYRSHVLPDLRLRLEWLWQAEGDVWAMLGQIFAPDGVPAPKPPAVDA